MRSDLLKLLAVSVLALFMTAVLAATLGNISFGGTTGYSAVFTDASGLRARDDVRVNGVNVGSVSKVEAKDVACEPGQSAMCRRALVSFKVDSGRRLTTATKAIVKYKNVIGQRYLDVSTPQGLAAPRLEAGSQIPVKQTIPALDLTTLFNGFRPLFDALEPDQINTLAGNLVQTLQGESGTVASLVSQLASLTGALADRDAVIGRVITNLDVVATTVASRDNGLRQLLTDLRTLTKTAADDRLALTDTLSGIDKLASSADDLLRNARPPAKQDIAGLNAILGTVVSNQATVTRAVQGLPGALGALNRGFDSGTWLAVYGCDLTFRITSGTFDDPGKAILSGVNPKQPAACS